MHMYVTHKHFPTSVLQGPGSGEKEGVGRGRREWGGGREKEDKMRGGVEEVEERGREGELTF